MKITIEVRRERMSATQGEAAVYMNGHKVMSFADKIELLHEGDKYYGDWCGDWASVKPDMAFIRGCLCHDYEKIYDYHREFKRVLDLIEPETPDEPSVYHKREV